MRYTMRNAAGEILVDIMEEPAITFLYGSREILPALEKPLVGLQIGEGKTFSISPDESNGLHTTLYFDVIIDDIRWANEVHSDVSPVFVARQDCGPGCIC